ncbi:MAG: MAPEG family protein [Mesorhizobium sp.]|jgi:glutathione S-transferase|uniref:MAPEG family protein n=1 Tax=Mesorhizobium sp. TaxID=1871066 RepID=UPI001209E954|nr:MAPEG family protein [Mesorhizobium sp.]TIM06394.1 MAG: MAPEG family protein [Mesorhizobium sp.]
MQQLSFENPVFAAFAISAAIMGLKAVAMSWLTVIQMMRFSSGFRSPEDLKRTPFNPSPDPKQLQPDERVERIRRIQLNDLENLPFFFMAGALYVLTDPPLVQAQWLYYGYAVSRLLHFAAYFTAQIHEVRATFWTVGSLIIVYMAVVALLHAL